MKTLSTQKSQNLTKEELLNAIMNAKTMSAAICGNNGECVASI